MLQASNIHYEVDERHQGIAHGGIGVVHLLAQKILRRSCVLFFWPFLNYVSKVICSIFRIYI